MTGKRRLGLVAAGATLLAAAPLSAIFGSWTWLVECAVAVGFVAGVAMLARTLRLPLLAQFAAMVGVLVVALTWMFPSGSELIGILPSFETFGNFADLVGRAPRDAQTHAVPVPDDVESLQFLAVVGVGAVAIMVDLFTVTLRRPALAGLPMLAIYSVPVAVYIDSVPVVPFMIGAVGFLWLLVADNVDRVRRFGRRFTGDGRDVDVWEPSPLAAAGRRLAVLGVAAAVLLPLAVPGFTTGVLSQLTQSGVGPGNGRGGGLSDSVDLFANLSGTLTQNDTFDMVKVTTTEREPFYLRFGVADVVDENGFREQDPQGLQVSRGLPEPEIIAGDGVSQQAHRATVEVTNRFNMRRAPLYPTLRSTGNFDGSWLYDADTGVLFSTRESSRGRRYEFDYVRTLYSEQALRTAPELPANDPIRRRSGVVPNDPFVAELVDRLTRDADTEYDKVEAIYRHFSAKNGFTYNLTTKPATNASQIVSFLQNKIGFCQQYAAAMAWMVREAGIPARVAFGFTRGTARDRGLVMTNRNLHAWTEVYFSGFGWVPFDATPASAVVGAARSEWAPDVDRVDQAPTSAGPAPSTSAGGASTAPSTPDRDRDRDLGAAGGPGTITPTGPSWQAVSAVGGTVLLLILLSLPAVLRMLRRRRRHAATLRAPQPTAAQPDQDPSAAPRMVVTATDAARARRDAHAAWDELVDTMIDYDVDVDPTETPRVTANRLVRQVSLAGPAAEAATLLGRAEERARYARAPLAGQELTTALDRVRHAVAAGSSRRTRLRAAVLPPSVLLRWRHALGGTTERVVALFSRAGDALIRFSPRRLLPHRR